jgi:hypothetical protein
MNKKTPEMKRTTRMNRRGWLAGTAQLALGTAAYFTLAGAHAQPSYTVTAGELQDAVAKRFPARYPVGGFLEIKVQAPNIRLLPEQNRLGAVMAVEAAGPALRHGYNGSFDLDLALRYEPSDLTIRASQLRVNALQFDDLPPQTSALLAAYGPQLAQKALQDAVLHQLKPEDLALPNGMGLQPGSITVTARGLVIAFVNKPLS